MKIKRLFFQKQVHSAKATNEVVSKVYLSYFEKNPLLAFNCYLQELKETYDFDFLKTCFVMGCCFLVFLSAD